MNIQTKGLLLICALLVAMGCSRKQTQVTPLSPQVLVATVTQQGIPAGQKPVATHNGFRSANINAQVQGYLIALCDSAAVLFGKT